MINKITEWSYDRPSQPGKYLVCYGDVETKDNVSFREFHLSTRDSITGLYDEYGNHINDYSPSYKYALLIYSPSELKRLDKPKREGCWSPNDDNCDCPKCGGFND